MKITNNLPKKLEIQEQLGYLSNLKTVIKDSLVSSINWLYDTIMNKLGETDISSIGDGTITGAIKSLDSDKADNSLIGNDKLSTNASTLTGAVNEINNNLITDLTNYFNTETFGSDMQVLKACAIINSNKAHVSISVITTPGFGGVSDKVLFHNLPFKAITEQFLNCTVVDDDGVHSATAYACDKEIRVRTYTGILGKANQIWQVSGEIHL